MDTTIPSYIYLFAVLHNEHEHEKVLVAPWTPASSRLLAWHTVAFFAKARAILMAKYFQLQLHMGRT